MTIEENLKEEKKELLKLIEDVKREFSARIITYAQLKIFRKEIDYTLKIHRKFAKKNGLDWDLL